MFEFKSITNKIGALTLLALSSTASCWAQDVWKLVTSTDELKDGMIVTLYCEEAGVLSTSFTNGSTYLKGTDGVKVNGDDELEVPSSITKVTNLKLVKNGTAFNLIDQRTTTPYYLYAPASSTSTSYQLKEGTGTTTYADNKKWSISFDGNNAIITTLATIGNGHNKIAYTLSGTTHKFVCTDAYSDTYKHISLYRLIADSRVAPEFKYKITQISKYLSQGATNMPKLYNNSDGEVTYTSSNPAVATVDENGNVTFIAGGTTTITATVADTDNFKGATTSYVLTLVDEEATSFTWIAADQNYAKNEEVTDLRLHEELSATFAKGSATSAPSYYETSKSIKALNNSKLTVTSDTYYLQKVEFEMTESATLQCSEGTVEGHTWTGCSRKVVFTFNTESTNYIKNIKFAWGKKDPALFVTYPLTVSQVGFSSLYLDYPVVIPEGVTVYYGYNQDDKGVYLAPYSGQYLPANCGVIVKAATGTYNFTETDQKEEGWDDLSYNVLTGYSERTANDTSEKRSYTVYAFHDGEEGIGFYEYVGEYVPANKAFAIIPKEISYSASVIRPIFDDDTQIGNSTAITTIKADAEEGATYDLYGRRVMGKAQKGLYIVNGKKVMK